MRFTCVWFVCLAGLLICGAASALTIQVDEFGNGLVDGVPIVGHMLPDPAPPFGGGLPGLVLTYDMPFQGVVGNVVLMEPGLNSTVSDMIFFNGNGTLVFYSDMADGAESPADTGFPPNVPLNHVTLIELGSEGMNGAVYTPAPGEPGYSAENPATFIFISDIIPEPAWLSFVGLGLFAIGRRRK